MKSRNQNRSSTMIERKAAWEADRRSGKAEFREAIQVAALTAAGVVFLALSMI